MSKIDILHEFIKLNEHLPKQGSEEWLKGRGESIGGSEISIIMGLNPYSNIKKLINTKAGITNFTKSAPLWFGNIMEYILQQYTEIIYNTKIYEIGSIQHKNYNFLKYSPDGIAVIEKKKLKNIFSNKDFHKINLTSKFNNENHDNLIVLFEFKNPYMRQPIEGKVPSYYIPQPVMGLDVIDICEVSIFIEAVIRFCSYNDIINLNNKYNTRYHFDKIRITNIPLAFSAFSLYYEKNNINKSLINIINELICYIHNTNNDNDDDIGNIYDKKIINLIMENIIDIKDIKIEYHNVYINDINDKNYHFNKYNNINKFKNEIKMKKEEISKNYCYLGFMSIKIFKTNINPIYKDNIFNDIILDKINNVINIIKKCNSTSNLVEKKNIIKNINI